jgi:tetratricopeptide (TPR) repeat protein
MSAMHDLPDLPATDAGQEFLNRLRQRAFSSHRRGELEAAESAYQRILEKSPADFEVRRALGALALQTGKHRWAIQLLSQVAQYQDSADLQAQLGTAYCGLMCLDDALRCYERAIAAQFDHMTARINRAQVLHAVKRFKEAASAYARTIELGLDNAEIHTLYGVTLDALGRTEESIACFDRALTLDPGYVPAHVHLGTQLRKLKTAAEAAAEARAHQTQQTTLDSRSFDALIKSSAALIATGHFEAALEAAECAIALRPDAAAEAEQQKSTALAGLRQRQATTPGGEANLPVEEPRRAAELEVADGVVASEDFTHLMAELPQEQTPAPTGPPPPRLGSLRRLDWSVLLAGAAPTVASCILSALVGSEFARAAIEMLGRGSAVVVAAPVTVHAAAPKSFDVESIVSAHLFGQVQENQDPAAALPSRADLKLTGTLATGDPHHGIAIIGEQGKSHVYSIGESLDGASLWEVFQDHVILERNGSYESLSLPRARPTPGVTHE